MKLLVRAKREEPKERKIKGKRKENKEKEKELCLMVCETKKVFLLLSSYFSFSIFFFSIN